jgi:hypothetical protein
MKIAIYCAVTFLLATAQAIAQLYQGPASGSISGGVIVTTDDFPLAPPTVPEPERRVIPHPLVDNRVDGNVMPPPSDLGQEMYKAFQYDPSSPPTGPPPIEIASFEGIPDDGSIIPPDPHTAAGPNHIMACVNSKFRISDKQGNTLKTINASSWYQSVLGGAGPFDPQIMYDHFHGRWIMLWDHLETATAYWLISVSDDDNPLGVWYNWALPAHLNGNTSSGTWGDYPGIGYDEQALYIVSREFTFSGFYQWPKLRIVGTDQLYQNDAGPVTWTDLWSIRGPNNLIHDGLRPSVVFSYPTEYYLISPETFQSNNTRFALYRLTDPLGSPVMTSTDLTVDPGNSWNAAPNANQLGGGSLLIEAGGSRVRHAAVYRDSSIWMAHSVANGAYSDIRYVRIDVPTNTILEDARLGATGFWHYYPSLMVDKDGNIAITFSRSANTEYIGAGMMWRLASDPPGLQPAMLFKEGEANYVEDFGSGRNRWGDYMGISLDPIDQNNFWMFTEYAESPANTWGTWWYNTRLVPYENQYVLTEPRSHEFGSREVGTTPDTLLLKVFNVGAPDLNISSISNSHPAYTLIDLPSLPVILSTYDSIAFSVVFDPLDHGDAIDSVVITSDDPLNPNAPIQLSGRGVVIGQAVAGRMYASSGPIDGQLYQVDLATAAASPIGSLRINELQGLAIRPTNNEIYGVASGPTSSTLYRVSSSFGDALPLATIALGNLRAIAFSAGDTLYGGTTAGGLYRIDPATGDAVFVGQASGVPYSGLSFSPTSGVLWASVVGVIGRDRIYTVSTADGDTTLVGRTGDNADTPSLAFGPTGVLYGLKGISSQTNTLITIDTLTAVGTLIGSAGVSGLKAITMRTDSIVLSVEPLSTGSPPVDYSLAQNFPNPFNPTTAIRVAIPEESNVTLTVHNVLGQEVRRLLAGRLSAGVHMVSWDGTNNGGQPLASGVYIYRIHAKGGSAREFNSVKKMLLLR